MLRRFFSWNSSAPSRKLTTTLPRLTMLTTLTNAPSRLSEWKYAKSAMLRKMLIRGIDHDHLNGVVSLPWFRNAKTAKPIIRHW